MKKLKEILIKVISAAGLFFTAVFYVLYQQKKDENSKIKEELLDASNKKQNELMHDYKVNKEKADEQISKATGGNKLSNANAGLDILRK